MLINCPYCGSRPNDEFTIKGDATPQRPMSNDADSMSDWFEYVYIRENTAGRMREFWHHAGGCRAWLVVERDTITHEVYDVQAASDVAAKQS